MKLMSRSFFGLFTAVLGATAVLVVSHFTSWGRDSQPAFNVSATPINRDARLGTSFAPIVKKVAPSVVNIFTTRFVKERPMRNPLLNDPIFRQFYGGQIPSDDRERTRKERSLGSGVIVSADGYILTANHVVAEADEIKVFIGDNKKEFTARVIGKDQATDVAVLKIEANNLPAVTLADSDQLEIGDIVLALGNPYGVGQSVTMGIVSALGRSGLPGFNQYQDFIQTDAAINPGNSGGALVDAEGRLVGINTAIISRSGGNQGIGFAVPINMARKVMEQILRYGEVKRGRIGVVIQDLTPDLAQAMSTAHTTGAVIARVDAASPAERAGLHTGDLVVAVNGVAVRSGTQLRNMIGLTRIGDEVELTVDRRGAQSKVAVHVDPARPSAQRQRAPNPTERQR